MSQEQLEEMMQQGGSSGQEGQELQISLEQKEGGSAGKSSEQCVPAPVIPSHIGQSCNIWTPLAHRWPCLLI